jgi:5'-3' exonuclease
VTTLIIDASNMAYRARYSYSLSFKGRDTSVTYGVLRMLMTLVRDQRPDSVIMCFDGTKPLSRSVMIKQYKTNRTHDDDPTYVEYLRQLRELQRMLPYFGMLCVKRDGIEADDLMYHASRMVDNSIIVTNDDDLLQAVDKCTSVLKPLKKDFRMITHNNFMDEVGVEMGWFLSAKALLGDSSDNIPGCMGVGPATIKKIYGAGHENISDLNPTMRQRIRDFWDNDFDNVMQCISLQYDVFGSRQALLSAQWVPYTNAMTYKYCIDNAFTSLIEAGSLGSTFGPLKKPRLSADGYRVPRIWDAIRHPIVT